MFNSILIIAAHPDDEVLGCGGTMALMADQNVKMHVAFLADGISSRYSNPNQQIEASERRIEAKKACEILGVQSVSFGDFPDNRMDSVPLLEIIKPIETLIIQHRPDAIFTHHAGDLNIDHRRIHEAVVTACRPQNNHPVRTLLYFEVPSSTEWQSPGSGPAFSPNWFVDISNSLERKLLAFDVYKSEARSWPHPRSHKAIEHLSRWRGATMGAEAGEAFILGRHLI